MNIENINFKNINIENINNFLCDKLIEFIIKIYLYKKKINLNNYLGLIFQNAFLFSFFYSSFKIINILFSLFLLQIFFNENEKNYQSKLLLSLIIISIDIWFFYGIYYLPLLLLCYDTLEICEKQNSTIINFLYLKYNYFINNLQNYKGNCPFLKKIQLIQSLKNK